MATLKSGPRRIVRNAVLKTVGLVPVMRNRLQMNLSGLSHRAATIFPA
jgi:hypothetical protein